MHCSTGAASATFVLIFAVLAWLFVCCSRTPEGSSDAAVYNFTNRVSVIGDSISEGINPVYSKYSPTYGWVHMINGKSYSTNTAPYPNIHSIWPETWVVLSNFALSGSTASLWNNIHFLQPVIDFDPDIVIVFIGGNDVLYYIKDGVIDDSEQAELSNNFCGILDILTNNLTNTKIVLVDYYDLADGYSMTLTNPYYSSYSYYSNLSAYVALANSSISNIALERGCYFVDIYKRFMHHCYGKYLGDTGSLTPIYVYEPIEDFDIHPVTSGHRKICDEVLVTLKNITN